MHFYPAIDLKDGQCVRLLRGDMEKVTVFADNPATQAEKFAQQGCQWLHVVDLNGAFAGRPVNGQAVSAILDKVEMKVQLGGGIRDISTIEYWLDQGITRVILGTIAVRDPELVKTACKMFPGKVALGIDARDGFVAVEGWAEVSKIKALEMAKQFEDAGAAAIIHTDIGRDGAMQGPNAEATLEMARAVSIPLIVSGGVSSMDDLIELKAKGSGLLDGVISGRAVYDGLIDPAAAVALLAEA